MKTIRRCRKWCEAPPPPPLDEIAGIIAAAVKRLAVVRTPSGSNRKNILQTTGYNGVIML